MDSCHDHISTANPEHLRPKMLEYLHHVMKSDGGEFATVGTFIPMWVKHLEETRIVAGSDLSAFKRFMRVVAIGGRLLMREFARIREVSEGDARQLRQLSIVQFVDGGTQEEAEGGDNTA